MFSYKKLVVLICGLMVMMCGFVKAEAPSSVAAAPKKVVLRYYNAEGPEQVKYAQAICDAFMKENPDIQIESVFGITKDTITLDLASNQPPDVFMWWGGITDLKESGKLLSLSPYVKKQNVDLKKYYKALVDFYTYDNELYGMPLQMNTRCVLYNKDLFDKEKMTYPAPGWTWQDYYFIAKRFTKDMNRDGIREQFGSTRIDTGFFLYANGSNIVDFVNRKSVIDTKENRIMIDYLMKLRRDCCPTKLESSILVANSTASKQDFYTGAVAMEPASAWILADYATIKSFKWDVVPLPSPITGEKKAIFDEACLVISKNTKNSDAAWKFVNFYCGEKGMKIFVTGKDGIPADMNIARKEFIKGLPASTTYYLVAADVATVPMAEREPDSKQYFDIFNKYFDQFYYENRGLDETLKNITWDSNELLKKTK